jgi:hypothetical protein
MEILFLLNFGIRDNIMMTYGVLQKSNWEIMIIRDASIAQTVLFVTNSFIAWSITLGGKSQHTIDEADSFPFRNHKS